VALSELWRYAWLRLAPVPTALSLAAAVAACGGAVSSSEAFVPGRVLAFGDEASTLLPDGLRWGINAVDPATGAVDCRQEPNWVQSVASDYGHEFAECRSGDSQQEPRALMSAAPGAKVADVSDQVDAVSSTGGVRDRDLALVLAGANDLWELYEQFPSRSEAALTAEARVRADRLAAVVNRLVGLGAKVVVVNLPDLGLSPYARAERALHEGSGLDRAALISRLTTAFNERLGIKVLLDGRYVGLVQLDQRSQAIARSPGSFGFNDIGTGACTVPIPACTTGTLVDGATSSTYLWADGKHLSSGGQSQIASLAIERARGNPF
jgi:outer membrane lipase/esterase